MAKTAVSVTIEDHSDLVLNALDSQIAVALEKVGLVAEGYAKRKCPVDTGRLRNSITHAQKENTMYIGTNVEYAPFVELGTYRTKPKPYMRPALENHISQYRDIILDTLKNTMP